MQDPRVSEIFRSFWAFRYVGRLSRTDAAHAIAAVNAAVAGLFFVLFLFGGGLDHPLFLPGRGVGLLEHPTIFAFLAAQVIVPRGFVRAIGGFLALGDASPTL